MNQILQKRVVPVAVIDEVEDAVPLADALLAAGLDVIEVTFRTAAAPDAIRAITKAHPGMLVGAGTLLDVNQVRQAKDAGAKFGVAPGLNPTIVQASLAAGMPFVPGVATASDVERGLELGCKIQKLFPADVLGGVKLLKAFAGPYAHTGVKFIPLGGVNAQNMSEYLALPIVAAIGGSWIVDKKLIAEKKWGEITALTKTALAIAQQGKA
ncbi:MAG: bifunctional 4-hydroxy-2-oxoglutarate aldolase/2-dehydro-3-deoxy-phosphogluconate aldolase [Verrucomicrobiota bacterium]